jgi:hypothetical protein
MSLHTLFKEIPGDIKTEIDEEKEDKPNKGYLNFEDWLHEHAAPRAFGDSDYSDEENGKYYWDLHKRYNEYVQDWKNHVFGYDKSLPKSIVRIESDVWATDSKIHQSIVPSCSANKETVKQDPEKITQ